METTLAHEIGFQDIDSQSKRHDAAAKRVLSCKEIAASILQSCLDEFKPFSREQIMANLDDPSVGTAPLDPGQVRGINTEDHSDGSIYYDVLFTATVPDSKEKIRLIINLEAQHKSKPGYSLARRGLYYCARLISSQKGREFIRSEYDNIRKVCSIWIIADPEQNKQNAITSYDIRPTPVKGDMVEEKDHYDLMQLIFLYIGGEKREGYDGILEELGVLFDENKDAKEKIDILEDKFDLKMSYESKGAVSDMCNLSEGIIERSEKKGTMKNQIQNLHSLMSNLNISLAKAMELLDIPKEDQEAIIAAMGQ